MRIARRLCVAALFLVAVLPAVALPWRLVSQSAEARPRAKAQSQTFEGALDLNTASISQLAALPGMGTVYAQRVAQGRPYTAKNQLVTRGVLPQAAYEQIKDRVIAHRSSKSAKL